MVLYVLLGVLSALGIGFAAFQAGLHFYLAWKRPAVRRLEAGNAIFKASWVAVSGAILDHEFFGALHDFVSPSSYHVWLVCGLGAATFGLAYMMKPVIDRAVEIDVPAGPRATGPAGPAGPAGEQGETGARGRTGKTGPAGANGV